jgi:hypothetical protein
MTEGVYVRLNIEVHWQFPKLNEPFQIKQFAVSGTMKERESHRDTSFCRTEKRGS